MQRARRESVLATVLFTDIVGSSEIVAEMGDRRWSVLLSRHHALVRRELRRFGGRELDTAGDGFFASFENPGNAIRCAASVVEAVQGLGIDVRTGLHLGQAEIVGRKLGGVAVHIGARTMAQAGPAEVMVTGGLKEVLPPSDFRFEDRGTHTLKGVPGEWRLFRLTSLDKPLPLPLEAPVAAERRAAIQPPPIWRRPYVPAAAAVLLLGGVAGGLLLVGRGEPSKPAPTGFPAHALLRLDAHSGRVLAVVPIGDPFPIPSPLAGNPCTLYPRPRSMAAGEGSVWVTNGGSDSVLRLDAHSGRRRTITVSGRPVSIGVGRSGVWVVATEGGLTRIDPGTEGTKNVDISEAAPVPLGVAVDGRGSVYVTAYACTFSTQLTPLVKVSGSGASVIALPVPQPAHAVEGFSVVTLQESVWITAGREVWKVEAATGKVLQRVKFEQSLGQLAADEDDSSVWLTTVASGGQVGWVYQIEAATGRIINQHPVGCCPGTVAIGEGYVWITNSRDGTIQRISRVTGDVAAPITVGRGVDGIVVGEGGVWVTIDR